MTDSIIAKQLLDIFNGNNPSNIEYSMFLARLAVLLFVTECCRNPSTIIFVHIGLDLIEKGEMTWAEFLYSKNSDTKKYKGGVFPMSITTDSGPALAQVSRHFQHSQRKVRYAGYPGKTSNDKKMLEEFLGRQNELLNKWFSLYELQDEDDATKFNALKRFMSDRFRLDLFQLNTLLEEHI